MEEKNIIFNNEKAFNNFSIFKMKVIPQVILLYSKEKLLNDSASNILIKNIICKSSDKTKICSEKSMCESCIKFENNNYFDFKKYDFNKVDILNKSLALNIISDFSKANLETGAVKVYLINQVEFSSIAAINTMLKILENLTINTYIIFTTTNINKILPTIKSRCQLISSSKQNLKFNDIYNDEQLLIIKIFSDHSLINDANTKLKLKRFISIIEEFIMNENNNHINNQLLVKKITSLKEEINYFFKFLNLVVFNKLSFIFFKKYDFNNLIIKNLVTSWNTNNEKHVAYILEQITFAVSKWKVNVNLNLLVNFFLIKVSS